VLNIDLKHIIESHNELQKKEFRKNDVIFSEGEKPQGIYCIKAGKVKILKNQPRENKRIVYLASNGEILGLHAVVNSHPYTNTAIVIDKTKTVFLPAEDFVNLVESDNAYKLMVMQTLCSRIEIMEHHINLISEMQSEQKFADTLLMLIRKFGIKKTKLLNINLSIDDLASFTCTSKSYMKKIISDFSQKGLIAFQNGDIKIFDRKQLESIAYNGKN